MRVNVEDHEYDLIVNNKEGFDEEAFLERCTDYFYEYDYIVGDIAYNKLRLKGFYKSNNKKASKINNYDNVNDYMKNSCAVDCKYFVLEKIK